MPRLRRLGISSLLRLINREETADDDIALLDYLALHASDHLLTFQHAIRRPHSESGGDYADDRQTVRLEDISPIDISEHASHEETALGMSPTSALERIFGQLRRRLLGGGSREKDAPQLTSIESDDANNADDRDQLSEQSRVEDALNYFDGQMRELVDADAMEQTKRNSLFVLWLEVTMHMLVGRQSDRAGALAFLGTWFRRAITKC